MKKLTIITLTIVMLFSVGIAFATNQGYLSVSPDKLSANGTASVQGSGFKPNTSVSVTLDGVTNKTVTAGADGSVSFSVAIPSGTTPGIHSIAAQGVQDPTKPGVRVEPYSEGALVLIGNIQVTGTEVQGEQVTPGKATPGKKTVVTVLGEQTSSQRGELPFTGGTILLVLLVAGLLALLAGFGIKALKKN